jgi:hypothetical protein
MCAHSMLTESGNVTFYSHSTLELAQRDVRERERERESSEDSNGESENNAQTKVLQTKEQRGHVLGVSSKLT